jgi:hypothetical protein
MGGKLPGHQAKHSRSKEWRKEEQRECINGIKENEAEGQRTECGGRVDLRKM